MTRTRALDPPGVFYKKKKKIRGYIRESRRRRGSLLLSRYRCLIYTHTSEIAIHIRIIGSYCTSCRDFSFIPVIDWGYGLKNVHGTFQVPMQDSVRPFPRLLSILKPDQVNILFGSNKVNQKDIWSLPKVIWITYIRWGWEFHGGIQYGNDR
jgi:hypothetical protein